MQSTNSTGPSNATMAPQWMYSDITTNHHGAVTPRLVLNMSTTALVWHKTPQCVVNTQWNTTNSSMYEKPCTYNETTTNVLPLGLKIPFGILMVLMIAVSVVGNSIVCLIVYQKPAMRSAINLLLANMAFSNILLAVFCKPFALVTLIMDTWVFREILCRAVSFFHVLFVCEAVYVLLAISVDRYLIIVRKKDKLNPHRAKILISVTWCFSILISFPPTVGLGLYRYYKGWVQCILGHYTNAMDLVYIIMTFCAIFFVPMIVMAYSYVCILKTVRRNSRRIQNHPGDSLSMSQANKLGLGAVSRTTRLGVDMSFKTRAFKTILILFLVYLCCWAPYAITNMVWNLNHTIQDKYIAGSTLLWLGYLNSALNPIIYCWRIKKFREACRELIPKSVTLLPTLPGRTRRRINPSAMYECNEQSTV